jgi:ADP-heptose:LPS heptosyltransferase
MQPPPYTAARAPRFLLIQRDNIGDLVLSTPFIRALRAHYPDARIDALGNSYTAPALDRNPHVDAIYTYTKWKHRPAGRTMPQHWLAAVREFRAMRRSDYDVAVLLNRGYSRHALRLALTTRARSLAGFVEGDRFLESRVTLPVAIGTVDRLHIVQQTVPLLHVIAGHRRGTGPLAEDMPPCELFPDPALRERLTQELTAAGILPRPRIVAVQVSARKLDQRWPAQRFVELIHALHAQAQCAVLLFWSPGDASNAFHPGDDAKAQAILDGCRGLPVHGVHARTLGETVAGFSLAQLMICSDGGAMHIAAGLQLPIVGMFGATVLDQWHPWRTRYIALRPPSLNVVDVAVADTLAAALRLLNEP